MNGQRPVNDLPPERPMGIAWKVVGNWQQNAHGAPVLSGDPILPGGLLMPRDIKVAHSITLLLPDGQRVLYECFTEEDCARGFRTPVLTGHPTPFVIHMLQQISRAIVLSRGNLGPSALTPAVEAHTTVAKRDEALAVLDRDHQASVEGLLSKLSNGDYTYNLEPLDHRLPPRLHVTLKKSSSICIFPVPSAGLYDVSIWDSMNTPRIELFLAAIQPDEADAFSTYAKAKKILAEWDADFYGWPIHDLQRAYLQALMLNATGSNTSSPNAPPAISR